MVRQLGGEEDAFLSYRTGEYKLHYFETPTQLKFVLLTDTRVCNLLSKPKRKKDEKKKGKRFSIPCHYSPPLERKFQMLM